MDTKGLRAYLISPEELKLDWLILYAATFAIQLLLASLRGGIAYVALWFLFKLAGEPTGYLHLIVFAIAYGPLAFSLLTLIVPVAASWPPAETNARYPSQSEQDLYKTALAKVRQVDQTVRAPRQWYLHDADETTAIAYADSMLISRGLLEHQHSPFLLAQALRHLNTSDARLKAAVGRLTITPPDTLPRGLKTICALASGTAGMWPLTGSWDAYWRTREHDARTYAEQLARQAVATPTPVASTEGSRQVAGRSEPVKGTPSGPPTAGPDGLPLTEP